MAFQYEAFQLINSQADGALVSGLTPTIHAYLLSNHGVTDNAAYVTVNEVAGTGTYVIEYDPLAYGDAVVVLTFASMAVVGDKTVSRTFIAPPVQNRDVQPSSLIVSGVGGALTGYNGTYVEAGVFNGSITYNKAVGNCQIFRTGLTYANQTCWAINNTYGQGNMTPVFRLTTQSILPVGVFTGEGSAAGLSAIVTNNPVEISPLLMIRNPVSDVSPIGWINNAAFAADVKTSGNTIPLAVAAALGVDIATYTADQNSVAGKVGSSAVDNTAIATSVWANTSRTLTGAGSGIGPTAGLSTARIGARIRRYESQPLFAYVYTASDIPATIASVSTITYSIVSLQGDGSEAAITGHANVSLAPSSVLYDTIQSDAVATGWNFKHQIDLSLGNAFATLGRYIVRYKFTPVSGLPFWVDFDVSCG